MRGFAAWRRAGIEHPRTRSDGWQSGLFADQQGRGQLRRSILHRHLPLGKARQGRYRHGALQHDRLWRQRPDKARGYPGCGEPLDIGACCAMPCIDAQGHRRVFVVGHQHGLPLPGPIGFCAVDPPGRMIEPALWVAQHGLHDGISFADEAPQDRIDEAGTGRRAFARSADRLVHHRMFGIDRRSARPEQGQRADQQAVDFGRRGLRCQKHSGRACAAQAAQHMKAQALGGRAQFGRNARQQLGQRFAVAYALDSIGHFEQQTLQRWGLGGQMGRQGRSVGPRLHGLCNPATMAAVQEQ